MLEVPTLTVSPSNHTRHRLFCKVLSSCTLVLKVNCPSEKEIMDFKEKSILIGMLDPTKNKNQINKDDMMFLKKLLMF